MSDEYQDFAIETAKLVAQEEAMKLASGMALEISELTRRWANQLGENIQNRMYELGIPQVLMIELTWDPGTPEFVFKGQTYVGGIDDEAPE